MSADAVEAVDPSKQEWQTEAGGAEGEPQAAERILNQDEIDSLLGFGLGDDADGGRTGVRAIINSALVSYERLPMLEIVFDRLVRLMTTSLRNFTSDNVEVSLDQITSIRFGDYLNSIPLPAMLGVFKAEEWDNYGLLMVDSSLTYSIVDVLLGGATFIGLMLLGFRRRPEFWLIAALAIGVTLIGAVFVASPRRTLALWPVIACLSGIGFSLALRLARDAVASRLRPVPIA